jgi:hypothetical protein
VREGGLLLAVGDAAHHVVGKVGEQEEAQLA